jgi:hypothetical protein
VVLLPLFVLGVRGARAVGPEVDLKVVKYPELGAIVRVSGKVVVVDFWGTFCRMHPRVSPSGRVAQEVQQGRFRRCVRQRGPLEAGEEDATKTKVMRSCKRRTRRSPTSCSTEAGGLAGQAAQPGGADRLRFQPCREGGEEVYRQRQLCEIEKLVVELLKEK